MWPHIGPSGPPPGKTRTSNASAPVTTSDSLIRVGTAAANVQQLPSAASAFDAVTGIGNIFTFKKISNNVNLASIKAATGENIDGLAQIDLLTQYATIAVQSNGTSWDILFKV